MNQEKTPQIKKSHKLRKAIAGTAIGLAGAGMGLGISLSDSGTNKPAISIKTPDIIPGNPNITSTSVPSPTTINETPTTTEPKTSQTTQPETGPNTTTTISGTPEIPGIPGPVHEMSDTAAEQALSDAGLNSQFEVIYLVGGQYNSNVKIQVNSSTPLLDKPSKDALPVTGFGLGEVTQPAVINDESGTYWCFRTGLTAENDDTGYACIDTSDQNAMSTLGFIASNNPNNTLTYEQVRGILITNTRTINLVQGNNLYDYDPTNGFAGKTGEVPMLFGQKIVE